VQTDETVTGRDSDALDYGNFTNMSQCDTQPTRGAMEFHDDA
jgi:hypothetical protein